MGNVNINTNFILLEAVKNLDTDRNSFHKDFIMKYSYNFHTWFKDGKSIF